MPIHGWEVPVSAWKDWIQVSKWLVVFCRLYSWGRNSFFINFVKVFDTLLFSIICYAHYMEVCYQLRFRRFETGLHLGVLWSNSAEYSFVIV